MEEDVKEHLEAAMPSNLTIMKEEITIIKNENQFLMMPDVNNSAPNEDNLTSTKMTIASTSQFPKPIVVPKIEVDVDNNNRLKIVDMLDLDTESESEDSANEYKDITKQCDSVLNTEEIDLGTNIVTKDGDIKIYGLADNLGLHLPKTGSNIDKKSNVSYDSKNSDVSNVKINNVARKRTTNSILYSLLAAKKQEYINIKTRETPKPSTISKIVFENKGSNTHDKADTTTKNVTDSCFGNKMILGNRSKKNKFSKPELKVVAIDCYSEYVNSPNYCTDCDVLFTTYKAFDIHYIENHLRNIQDTEPEAIDKDDKDRTINYLNDENIDSKSKNAKKNTEGINNKHVKFKCKICSSIISTASNMKRHINNVHNAESDLDLFVKIEVSNTSSNNAKLQDTSLVNQFVEEDTVVNKTSSAMATNLTFDPHASSDSDSGNIFENNDHDDGERPIIGKTSNTNDKQKSPVKPGPNNIAELVSKIKNNHCVHCDKTFTSKEDIINHLYDLLLPQIYPCNICKEEFVTENNLKQHLKSHTNSVLIKITRLSEEEINQYLHTKSVDGNKSVENDSDDDIVDPIDTCGTELTKTASSPELDIIKDFKNNNRGINTKVVKFKCKLCGVVTSSLCSVKRHIKNIHKIAPKDDLFKRIIVSKLYRSKKIAKLRTVFNNSEINTQNNFTMEAACSESNDFEEANVNDESNPFTDVRDACDTDKGVTKYNDIIFNNFSTANSPVPKSVLFKCKSCDVHYTSCWAVRAHVHECSGPKPSWECPTCFKNFKFSNKDMHERQHQFLGDGEFVVYTMDQYNMNELSIKVLHCCPKCGVHYLESRFTKHYTECEQDIPKSYFCLKCDMLIGEVHKEQHNKLHTFNKYNVEDFIIIEYASTDAEQDDIIIINKNETEILGDIETMPDDSQLEVVRINKANLDYVEPNDIETQTDCRVARLIYCETCKTYISPFKPNNLAHFYGYCTNLLRTTCTICGLAFTCRSIYSHRNIHKRIRNFSLFNLVFYNMRFEQIDPALPELPKCSHCFLTFESLNSKLNHECSEPKYKSCYYCGDDFNEQAYKTHILFHEYVNRKTILPMSSNDIVKLQSIIRKKAAGSTYNFTFYQCEECSVVLDEINRDMHKKAKGSCLDLSHTYRKCFKCQLTILAKEFAHHSARHNRNSTFKIENFNIIPFQRNKSKVNNESKKKPVTDTKNINVLESAQSHNLKHANNYNNTNNLKELCFRPIVERKRKLVNDESNVNDKKKKTEIDRQTDSDESTLDIMNIKQASVVEVLEEGHSNIVTETNIKELPSLFKCRACEIVLLEKPTSHNCDDKEPAQLCDICKLKFYKKYYEEHERIYHFDTQLEKEKVLTYFGEKVNVALEKIYRCLCGLNFLTKAGILNHYALCNISTRVVKQTCTKCNLIFTPPVLFNHLVTHHSKNRDFRYEIIDLTEYKSEKRDEVYLCEVCNAHFVVKELCEMHIENCKGENRKFTRKCPNCYLDFNVEALPLHRRKHHVAKQMKVEDYDIIIVKAKTNELIEKISDENEFKSVKAQDEPTDDTPTTAHLNIKDNLNIDSEIVTIERKLTADKIFHNIVLENYSHVIYKCARCDLHFTGSRSFTAHIAKQHAQNIIVVACSVCSLRFSSEACMRHEYIHHTKMNLKLEDFEFKTDYEKPKKIKKIEQGHISTFTLTKEDKEKISKSLITNIIYKCSKCDIYFLTPNAAIVHVRRFNHNFSRKIGKCTVCDISMTASSLERHKYIHHELNNYTFKDLKVKVDVPFSYTNTGKHLNKSLIDLNIYSNKIYKCCQCDLSHLTFGALAKHVESNHHIKTRKVKCSICNENFAPLGLAKHKYVHHKTFKFNKDEFVFEDEISLSHLLEKRIEENLATEWKLRGSKQTILYRCEKCNVCFLSRKSWRIHNSVHIDLIEKQKRKCNECGLNFKSVALKWHKNVHHREKGYKLEDFWIEERCT